MSSSSDDTILPPPRRPIISGGLDVDTVLPPQNAAGIHVPGDVIDNRYSVIREIGRGGMGVVYEVEDDLVGIRVAVKRLLPELAQRADLIEVFKREGRNALRFTAESPRFVTIRHLGADTRGLYLVMDFVEDITLRALLDSEAERRLRVATATVILTELAYALSDLHQLGFVHRDLKPENIFVQRIGGDQVRVRLVDFGLTKDDAEGTRTSIRGAGTSGYSSPEQRKGLPTTPATDIYAFGVIAYEMLTGELPGIGDAISEFVDNVPTALDETIMRCLATRSERRPQAGAELARLLGEPSFSGTPSQPDTAADAPPPVRPPVVHVGTLILSGVPDGAVIRLDGVSVSGQMHKLTLNSESQSIELLIHCAGFEDYQRKVLLTSGVITDHAVAMPKVVKKPQHRLAEYPLLGRYVHTMRQIPGGTFQMGSVSGSDDEKPVHSVSLSSFWLGATPVTVAVWKEYCEATGVSMPEAPDWGWLDDHPVVNVSWEDIMGSDGKGGFCAWASEIAGGRLKLPTEAQFEYAARGGQSGLEYPWGNTFDRSKLWSSGAGYGDAKRTAPVVRTSNIYRNAYGLTDMSGNVYQWCSDWYGSYGSASELDPKGPPSSSDNVRCVRGGSWSGNDPDYFRCAIRFWFNPDFGNNNIGFRLSAGPG